MLTLKTGDRLKDVAAIDWPAIVEYMGQYERSQLGLAGADGAVDRALAMRNKPAAASNSGQSKKSASNIECYNCHKLGHYAAECPHPDRRQKEKQQGEGQWKRQSKNKSATPKAARAAKASGSTTSEDDSDDAAAEGKSSRRNGAGGAEQANMMRALNRFAGADGVGDDEDEDLSAAPVSQRRHAPAGRSYLARVLVGLASPAQMKKTSSSQELPVTAMKRPHDPQCKVTEKPAEKKKVTFGPQTEAKAKESSRRAPPSRNRWMWHCAPPPEQLTQEPR